jgi:hypothetical protein
MDRKWFTIFLEIYTSIGYFKGFLRLQNLQNLAAFPFVFSSNLQKQEVNWGKDAQKIGRPCKKVLVNVHKFIENWLSKTTLKKKEKRAK